MLQPFLAPRGADERPALAHPQSRAAERRLGHRADVTGLLGQLIGPLEMRPARAQVTLLVKRVSPVREGRPDRFRRKDGDV